MLSLTGYFDAAGHQDGDHALIVGGYVAAVPAWLKFARAWNKALAKAGLQALHMTDFMACAPPYRDWRGREDEQDALLLKLVDVTNAHVRHSFSSTVILDGWRAANKVYELQESHLSPYGLAGFFVIDRMMRWIANRERKCRMGFIFENGDKGKGDLIWLVDQVARAIPYRKPILTFHPEKIPPLQAADFVLWEQRRLTRDRIKHAESPPPVRHSLINLMKGTKRTWGILDEEAIVKFCEDFHVPKRGASGPKWSPVASERTARAEGPS